MYGLICIRGKFVAVTRGIACQRQRFWRATVFSALELLSVLCLSSISEGATFSCQGGDVTCLINAIVTANANGKTNTIHLKTGIYTVSAPFDVATGSALPVITSTLKITGAAATTTVIERDPANRFPFRLFTVEATGNLTLADLTLQNGIGPIGEFGAGVLNHGILTIVRSVIKRNHADGEGTDGGISSDGTLTVLHSTITENSAGNGCGGLGAFGPTLIAASSITHNSVSQLGGGGGLCAGRDVIVENSTIAGNHSFGFGGEPLFLAPHS